MAEDRLDRIERNLERYTEESNQRMTRLERILTSFSKDVARSAAGATERLDQIEKLVARNAQLIQHNVQLIDRNALLIERTAQLIERNGQQIQFLRELTQGHISQSTPPAHAD